MQRLSNHLGQTFPIIIADQPLYSSSQELIWSQSDNYKNVIQMMGDLHVTFNFLRAIRQHMEGAGIDGKRVESGDIHGEPPWETNTESTAASCVFVDGSALIHSLRKPTGCSTFADYGAVFSKVIMLCFQKGASRG